MAAISSMVKGREAGSFFVPPGTRKESCFVRTATALGL